MKAVLHILVIFAFLFLMSSCSGNSPEDTSPDNPETDIEQQPEKPPVKENALKPLNIEESSFLRVIDWIDSESVLILKKGKEGNELMVYNIFTGDQQVIYTDTEYIVDAKISPEREKILIHTAPLTYSATVTIIDLNGDVLYQRDVESYEITFEWNEYNTDLLFITSFSEDWTYQTLLADISEDTLTEVDSPQPFIQWDGESSFLYQDWPVENISLSAPLYSQNIFSGEKVLVEEGTVHFRSALPYILAISMSEEGEGEGNYEFITEEGTIASVFNQPLLSSYSNWLIPYYDMIEGAGVFITLAASESMPADAYHQKFTLERWDIETGKHEEILTGMDNEPIQCSPSGKYCLAGLELKKAVDLSTKEAKDLIIVE